MGQRCCLKWQFLSWFQGWIVLMYYLSALFSKDCHLKTRMGYRGLDVTSLCNSGELNWLRGAGGISFTPESAPEIPNRPKTNYPRCGKQSDVGLHKWPIKLILVLIQTTLLDTKMVQSVCYPPDDWLIDENQGARRVDGDVTDLWVAGEGE